MHSSLLKIAIAAVLVLLLVFSGAAAAVTTVTTEQGLRDAVAEDDFDVKLFVNPGGKESQSVYIFELTETLIINKTGQLDLNGCVLNNTGSGSVIKIENGGNLTVTDISSKETYFKVTIKEERGWRWYVWECISETEARQNSPKTLNEITSYEQLPYGRSDSLCVQLEGGAITGGKGRDDFEPNYDNGGGVCVETGGMFTLSGGNIVGNTALNFGSGVKNAGMFNMTGGNIVGNDAQMLRDNVAAVRGCGVYNSGEFNMNGGKIVVNGNRVNLGCPEGGGVWNSGTFNMYGNALIKENIAFSMGGGVYNKGTFNMYETAHITGNAVTNDGGGVHVNEGTFNMYGSASITGNSANYGGGVYVENGGTTFNMYGDASITGNTITSGGCGGGVRIGNGATFNMYETAHITGNKADTGGGVHVNEGTLNVKDTPVISGNTKKSGGTANNVHLDSNYLITVTGALQSGSYIGIINPLTPGSNFSQGSSGHTVYLGDIQFFHPDIETQPLIKAVVTSGEATGADSRLGWVEIIGARIGDKTYSTVAAAVAEVKDGQTIEMIDDSTEQTIIIPAGKNVTLDLNGYVLSNKDSTGSVIKIENGGNLTVKDSGSTAPHYFTFVNNGPWTYAGTTQPSSGKTVDLADFNLTEAKAAEAAETGTYHVKITGGVITGGSADKGGGVYVDGGNLTMSGGNIIGNRATNGDGFGGGGVYVINGGTFTVNNNASITGNAATNNGGGVYVYGGTFEMSNNASITGNSASGVSGGVHISSDCTFTMNNNASITGNSATGYGGVCVMCGEYGKSGGTFIMNDNACIIGNSATDDETTYGGGVVVYGGYDDDEPGGTFIMNDNASIIGNSATMGGGVVVTGINTCGMFTMNDNASITENSATNGGGVYVDGGMFEVSGTPFISGNTDKSATPKVNNVYLGAKKYLITVTGALQSGAYIGIAEPLTKNSNFAQGASEHTVDSDDAKIFHPDDETKSIKAAVTSSEATGRLGWVEKIGAKIEGKDGGYHTVAEAVAAAEPGDTIVMIDDITEQTIVIDKQVTLDLNGYVLKGTGSGAVIKVANGGNLTLTDSNTTAVHYFKFVDDGPWVIETTKPDDNLIHPLSAFNFTEAKEAGEYYVKITGGVISGGYADGGGVYVENNGAFTMSNGNIVGNRAKDFGGGVYFSGIKFTMNGGNITGNSATKGGGVYINGVKGGTLEMSGTASIAGNSAINGGGVDIDFSGTLKMSGTASIAGNSANSGGGVYIHSGTFTMNGGNITGNNATSGSGGGVYVGYGSGNTFEIFNGNITGNSANENGGGVFNAGSTLNMSGTASITGNSANGNGGGVCNNGASGTFEMSGTASITGNSANGNGGGVYNNGAFNIKDTPVIRDNKKSTAQNNVYLNNYKIITITGELKSGAYVGIINPLTSGSNFSQGSSGHTVSLGDIQFFHPDDETKSIKAAVTSGEEATGADSRLGWVEMKGAKIGDKTYPTVAAAVAEVQDGQTIEMIDDSTEQTIIIPAGKNVTLDLNGHVLSNKDSSGSVINVSTGGNLTIEDSGSTAPHYFTFVNNGPWTYAGTTQPSSGTTVDLADFNLTNATAAESGTYHIKVTGGVITGGSADNGGGVYVDGGILTLSGGNIVGNNATTPEEHENGMGGGVFICESGTVTMSGTANIVGNSAVHNGGGVAVWSGTFTMNNSASITGNNAPKSGGGVYVAENGTFTMNDSASITENSANDGAGVCSDGEFTMNDNACITENSATGDESDGGGVAVWSGTFTMKNNTSITENSAEMGGGVYVDSGMFNVKDAPVIKDNKIGDDANNVYLNSTQLITVTGALQDGAYIGIKNPLEKDAQFGRNDGSYTIQNTDADCFHPDSGTLIAKTDGSTLKWGDKPVVIIDGIEYFTVAEAVANASDGQIIKMIGDSNEPAVITVSNKNLTLDLNGHLLNHTGTGSVINVSTGGNLTIEDSNSTATHYFTFVNNGPWTYAGTTQPSPGTTVDLADFNLTNATAAESGTYHIKVTGGVITGGSASAYGGGVYVDGGTLTLSDGNIIGNSAYLGGGGVYVAKSGTFTMSGGNIAGNNVSSQPIMNPSGCGVYVDNGTFTMNGGNITGNSAVHNGGGVYVAKSGTFTMNDNACITENNATNGGGVLVNGGNFTMCGDASIAGNTATQNGGGVFVTKSGKEVTMSGGNIVRNVAGCDGGGVYVEESGTFNMTGGTIGGTEGKGNTATQNGGGVYVTSGGTFTMSDAVVSIIGNSASENGGGVYVGSGSKFEMKNGGITENTATQNGGGVYVAGGTFTMTGGIIGGLAEGAENTATNGGGVYITVGTFEVSGTPKITGNKAGENANNVDLTYEKITLTGALQSGAEIHITNPLGENTQFGVVSESCTGVTQTDADCFIADGSTLKAKLDTTVSPKKLTWAVGYTATFEMNGHGTPIDNTTVFSGNTVPKPADPTAEGYTFNGWYNEAACTNLYDFSTQVTQNITLYAKWTAVIQSYTIKFNGNGGTVTPETLTVKYGESVNLSEKVTATRDGYTHSGWALSSTGTAIYAAAQNVTDLGDTTLYAVWAKTEELSGINVTITHGSGEISGVTVELKQGSVVIKSAETDASGKAFITGVPKGTYTLVVTNGEKTKTRAVTIPGDSEIDINLPNQKIKSIVDVKSETGTPAVAVNGTDLIVIDDDVRPDTSVVVTVIVESKKDGSAPDVQNEINEIKKISSSGTKVEYLGITIEKETKIGASKTTESIPTTDNVLEFLIPYDFTGKKDIKLYRCHKEGEVLTATQLNLGNPTDKADGTYWPEEDKGLIHLYSKRFSTYSVGYVPTDSPQPAPSSGGSSRSSGASTILPAAPADTQGAQITHTITAQYAGHTFVSVSAGDASDLGSVSPEIAAAAEIKISTAKAAGIKVTNGKGAPALILTTAAAAGLDTVTFSEVYDIKPSNPNEKLTQVTVTVPKADVVASGLTTDDVTIYHFLEAYDLWVPLDTLQITEDEANYYYTAATDGTSPFGVLIKRFNAEPATPVQTSASPAPIAGIIAGLGAAGLLFGLRRK